MEKIKVTDYINSERLKDDLQEIVDELKTRITDEYERTQKEIRRRRSDVDSYIRYNPEKAVLMSVGAGFLLGVMIMMHHRR